METIQFVTGDIGKFLFIGLISAVLATLLTPFYTTLAYRYKWWKIQRTESTTGEKATVFAALHAEKQHTPTMAGTVFVATIVLITVLFNLDRNQTWLPLVATLGAAAVGLLDDVINMRGFGKGAAGLSTGLKFSLISLVALLGGLYTYYKLGYSELLLPFTDITPELGVGFVLVFMLVVVATGNAVNITDGLDGLAGGLAISAFGGYAVIAFLQGNLGIAAFCITIVGALFSYTWFNIYPARFFMGDVGSFALGTALGVVAVLTNTVALLPIIGIVFVVETGSSALQILSKKIFKRKIFKAAPIHHHFEAHGWPETKVTMRFWVIGQLAAAAGVLLAVVGGFIH